MKINNKWPIICGGLLCILMIASDEFKEFAVENGFLIEYRESIGGYVRR